LPVGLAMMRQWKFPRVGNQPKALLLASRQHSLSVSASLHQPQSSSPDAGLLLKT
jgi:hypothetical protein